MMVQKHNLKKPNSKTFYDGVKLESGDYFFPLKMNIDVFLQIF
jgi:hypothetical protein